MEHFKIRSECTGDVVTAISGTHKVAVASKLDIPLKFIEGHTINVKHTSDIMDLIEIERYRRDELIKKVTEAENKQ